MDGLQLVRKQETQDNNINLVTGEVTNARTNAEPFDYDNLKQRLDAMDRNLTSAIEGLEWKPSVPTFGDIATTYPAPEEGWTVSVDDTNEIFRYDETLGQWISIMTSFSTATQTAPGLMSAEDKKKLDGLNSANYVHKNGDVMTGNLTMTNNGKFVGDLEGNSTTTGRLQTPVQINGINFDGSMNITIEDNTKLPLAGGTLTGVLNANAGVVGNVTGNASTATKLQVERTINGVPFDGSKNIDITDDTKLPLTGGTITGNLKVDGTITGNLNGNATSSSKLETPRNINGVPFDGTGDINIAISNGADVTMGGYNKPGVGGAVNAGDNINQAIGKLEVNLDGKANAVHNHSSNEVVSMNGYAISTTGGAIAPGDSLNTAIGKLEYEIKNKSVSNMTLGGYTKPNSTSPIVQGDTINQAIGKLEYGLDQKAPLVHNQPSNTINALTGYVLAGNNGAITTNDTLNIALAKLENNANGKAPLNHNQGSNTINTMAGYNKGAVGGAITQGDTLNSAIGKLEVNLDGKAASNHIHNSIQSTNPARPTSANVPILGDRTLSMLLSTPTMTTGKPISDGYIMNFNWDSATGWTSQMFVECSDNPRVQVRGMRAGNWGNWYTLYHTGRKPTPADIGASPSNHTHNNYLPLAGGNMTGTINSSVNTSSFLFGNQGRAIINSTNAAGGYTAISKTNSTNGYFVISSFQDKFYLGYTAKTTVDAGTNRVDKLVTLLNEAGNTIFPGQVTATSFSGNATSATRLQNARTIQLTGAITGQASFDGSQNIQINTTLATQPKSRLVRLRNRVVVNTTTKTVNIGIGAFNVNNDVLNVYLSGVRLEPTVDYTNTQSQITLTGTNNFVNGDVVSFEVIQMQ